MNRFMTSVHNHINSVKYRCLNKIKDINFIIFTIMIVINRFIFIYDIKNRKIKNRL